METIKTNIWNVKVGDTYTFTNYSGFKVTKVITRVEEKSFYSPNRQSWGTLADYQKNFKDFQIIKGA